MSTEMKSEITVVFLTWPNHPKRWQYFCRCIQRCVRYISCSNYALHFKCVSESERDPKQNWYGKHLEDWCESNQIPLTYSDKPASLGSGMNLAQAKIQTKYGMIIQDDWYLKEPIDLCEGVDFMEENPDADLLRYCWPGIDRVNVISDNRRFRKLDIKGSWPYGDDPHIRRFDFRDKFGWYKEGPPHGISESNMKKVLIEKDAKVFITDEIYFEHCGKVTACLNDIRNRTYKR
jgi:hypothetical protein